MARGPRIAPGGLIYHVLNRASGRVRLFADDEDYQALIRVLDEALERHGTRLLAYCIMPNHWHLLLWPQADGELSALLRWLTTTHVRRWHQHRQSWGQGHVYQGRFKSFPVQEDNHLLTVGRYVERNPRRAGLVARAEQWRWSSLGQPLAGASGSVPLAAWPVHRPVNWVDWVNTAQTEAELSALRRSVLRGQPFGEAGWQQSVAARLGLAFTFRSRGRQPKPVPPSG